MYKKEAISFLSILFFLIILFTARACAISWATNSGQLTTYDYFDGYPSITQLANGMIQVVWARDIMGYHKIYCANSTDYGTTWSEGRNITDNFAEHIDFSPSITQSTDGTIWIVWASDRSPPPPPPKPDFSIDASPKNLTIQKGESDNSTIIVTSLNNFSEPVDLTVIHLIDNVTANLNPDQVTPAQNSTANSTLTLTVGSNATTGNYKLWVLGKGDGKSHTVEIALEVLDSLSPLSQYSSHLVFSTENEGSSQNPFKIYYKTSQDYGATWSEAIQLEPTSESEDLGPSILHAMNGTLWIAYQSRRTGDYELLYKTSSDGGASWSQAENITDNSNIDRAPSIMQAMDGRIWVAWSSYRTGYSNIYYKVYDGVSWSNAREVTTSMKVDSSPSILQSFDGQILVFYSSAEESETATADIYYKYLLDEATNTWSDEIQFTSHLAEDKWPSTIQTHNLEVWVVWTANRTDNMDIFYKNSLVGDITGPLGEPDNIVDTHDLTLVSEAFGNKEGDPNWEEYKIADITGPENPPGSRRYPPDKIVDVHDLATVGKNCGET